MHRCIIACITWSNRTLRSDEAIFRCSRHDPVQLQNPSMPYSPRLINSAISIVVLPNPITWLKVGSITSSHVSSPGWMRSLGFTTKQANGSSGRPMGTDRGKFAVSTQSLNSRLGCGDSTRFGPEVEAPLGIGKGTFLRVAISTTALVTSRPTQDCGPFDEGGNNTGWGLNAGWAGFGGPKKLVMAVSLSFLASPAFSLWALLVWWLRRFASPPLIEREHTSQYRVSIF